ncbi:unnamed protein product [Rotaria sp. Silwood2]|nr:unnamed protein product [Rotaria sp. Silwood2]
MFSTEPAKRIKIEYEHSSASNDTSSTSLSSHLDFVKCRCTSKLCYLEEKHHADCTLVYKNVNINIKTKHSCLQDFVVCLGEVKSPQVSLADESVIGQTLQHLQMLLNLQKREKIYGFLTNFKHITFFYIEANEFDHSIKYYKSQDLEMFNYLPATSSSINTITTTEQSRQVYINEDTWKILTKFLTMNIDFYEYTQFNINPLDDLLGDKYNIRRKLGIGATAIVFLLEKNEDNYSNDDLQHCVIKIFRKHSYSEVLSNELKITAQLKQFNNSSKFNLFFEDTLYSPPTGNICVLICS